MRRCAAKVQLPSECRISHSSQSTYFDAVALGKHPLEARLDIIPGHALGGVLGQIFQYGLEDKGRCSTQPKECQPLDHHGLPLPARTRYGEEVPFFTKTLSAH